MKQDKKKLPIVRPDARYEVGYGKPPEASRFEPGRSGNPKGRPRGSKNKRPKLNEERLKDIILDEAYRDITVRDGDRNVTVPMAQAIVRALAVNAAKGQHRAQRLFADLLTTTERPHSALGYLSPTEFLMNTPAPSLETLAVSALTLNNQTQSEDSGSNRP